MARILAKQCGYEARHINASDKRSAGDLILAMKNALTQNSHFTENGEQKPVCLIVDEVDGAVSGGVGFEKVAEFLRNCINKSSSGNKSEDEEKENFEMPNISSEGNNMIFKRRKGPRRNDNIFEL